MFVNSTRTTPSSPHRPHSAGCLCIYTYMHTLASPPGCKATCMSKSALEKCDWQHDMMIVCKQLASLVTASLLFFDKYHIRQWTTAAKMKHMPNTIHLRSWGSLNLPPSDAHNSTMTPPKYSITGRRVCIVQYCLSTEQFLIFLYMQHPFWIETYIHLTALSTWQQWI